MYRADIDGLRAVAVLTVLLFHCEVALFPGGYVGVDVFFVISGFLISRNLLGDIEAGRLSFRAFYVRRARRLLPALVATIALTLAVGALVMSPEHYAEAGRSALWAALSLSNLHFAMAAGYFEPASDLKPLLHTWSLSVEEQFYLLWPLTLALIVRFGGARAALWFVAASIPAGLALLEFWIGVNAKHAYFLTPFRGFQFMLGALCVWLEPRRLPAAAERAAFALGMALVLGTAVLYTPKTLFPGLHALAPTLGAALLVWAGRAPGLTRTLDNAPMLWIGRLSYSIYLVHWPIVVFHRYLTGAPFSLAEQAALALASVAFGWALYVVVEQPFRITGPHPAPGARQSLRPLALTGAGIAAVAVAGFAVDRLDGAPGRLALRPEAAEHRAAAAFEFLQDHRDGALRLGEGGAGLRVLIFGDSTMQNYVPALLALPEFANGRVDVITRGGCVMATGIVTTRFGKADPECRALRDRALGPGGGDGARYDVAFWSQDWRGYAGALAADAPGTVVPQGEAPGRWGTALAATAAALRDRADQLVIIGPQLRVTGLSPLIARIGPMTDLDRIAASLGDIREVDGARRDALAAAMAATVEAIGPEARFLDPKRLLCVGDACAFHADGRSLYLDDLHHTAAATPLLTARLRAALPELLAGEGPRAEAAGAAALP